MTAPTVDPHRVDVETLISLAIADLSASWPASESPEAVQRVLAVELPRLVALYGSAAAALGADYYDDMREQANEPGRFRAVAAELPDEGRIESLIGWGTGPLYPKIHTYQDEDGVTHTQRIGPDPLAAQSLVQGGFQRIVADADRNSVIGSLKADPRGKGWSRQTTGKSCPFCVMLAGRGTVYSASTANFSSHDNCDCIAVPVFGGDPRPVVPYVPTQRRLSDSARAANNARVREFIRANP